MPTISKQDYLKAIYQISSGSDGNAAVSTTEIASRLDVSKAATSEMVQRLSEQGYLNYEKYRGMSLTDEGRKEALNIIRRHRIWELFLRDILGLTWSEVHAEAELLEHSTSDFLIEKLDGYLGHPQFDPHGEPIPDREGNMPEVPAVVPLHSCEAGRSYKLVRVIDSSSELMDYFSGIGLSLNKEITVKSKLAFDNSTVVIIGNVTHSLSEKVAGNLFLVPVEDDQ